MIFTQPYCKKRHEVFQINDTSKLHAKYVAGLQHFAIFVQHAFIPQICWCNVFGFLLKIVAKCVAHLQHFYSSQICVSQNICFPAVKYSSREQAKCMQLQYKKCVFHALINLIITLEIHFVFHVSLLKPYHHNKEDPRRKKSNQALTAITISYEREVKEMLAHRVVLSLAMHPSYTEYFA